MPGFPGKSPDLAKVLDQLPDQGERLALTFLDDLCDRFAQVYTPGAHIVIRADGHDFGDLIHVPDHHIDAYSDELQVVIRRECLGQLDAFGLRDVI
ncbi:L-tyrosine/L-tryptophan isonitrile synthase family protein [Streptomyces albospinus]|uniref:L-tyrosine/L-tryptophan isonitrile synthase family protein n=1 Tax=Streptomyces albospinus TaxID=285515 RepID=UPI001E64E3CD|nr:L-tyrosine/L-tryptophan isonitrile synthase family protein [Streptomyces albospinus]